VLYGKQMYGTWADAGPLKVKELAELVGISAQQITEFRRGRSWVSQETFESILENMDHLSPGSKRYFCSLMANQEISRTDNKQILIDMIENANAEEIETALLAIGRKWAATSKQNQLPTYAEVS
jgi:transcriptional regulator with XRE-family HTH domain